ncbi:MAG: tetratricopeptide repeat protein [Planctomycetia bacterium]|nr:tetratricopeptide repeat protein [Planctomycetia bacterium]
MKKNSPTCIQYAILATIIVPIIFLTGCQIWRHVGVSSATTLASRQYMQQAVESLQLNEENTARQKLELALKTNPENMEARAMYADVLWDIGEQEKAISELKQVVDSPEVSPATYVKLARMYYDTLQWEISQKYLSEALRRDSSRSDAWTLQGRLYLTSFHTEKAASAFHQAIFYNPENWEAFLLLSDLYLTDQKPQRALETVQYVRHKFPPDQEPPEVLYREGLAMCALGRFSEAVETLTLADSRMPQEINILSALAHAQYNAGKTADALHTAELAINIMPENEMCLNLLRHIHREGISVDIHPQIGNQPLLKSP